jgi:hypothetical protein
MSVIVETRAERSERRRAETLADYNNHFADFCIEETKNTNRTPHEQLRGAVYKTDLYIQKLIKAKPQETSFYVSVALEFKRRLIAKLDELKSPQQERKIK